MLVFTLDSAHAYSTRNKDNFQGTPEPMQETDDLLIQAPHRALLEVHGPDAEDFLHRMATASVKTLPKISEPGKAVDLRPTLFLKGDGRLVANCWICRSAQPNSFLITTEAP